MYQFTNTAMAGLTVSHSIAKAGTKHRKVYAAQGVTPATQDTLNVYLSGSFNFEAGNFSQVMVAGDTSLDLGIEQYPAGVVCIETVLSDWGRRCCISSKKPWTRDVVSLTQDQTHTLAHDSLVVLTEGYLDVGGSQMRLVSYREVPKGAVVTAESPKAHLIVCRPLVA